MLPAVQALAQAAAVGKPVPMHSEGWSYTSIGVWAIFGVLVPAIITAIVKLLPIMRKLAMEREATLDDERRTDMATMREELAALRRQTDHAHPQRH